MKLTELRETTLSESSSIKVDRKSGVIRGVKLLGKKSRNGREYSGRAMRDAVGLSEGAKVYLDHPSIRSAGEDRQFSALFGEIKNAHTREDGHNYGDLHFLKSHRDAEPVCESAERFPNQFGLSHNVQGKISKRGLTTHVESVHTMRSIDLVTSPATNDGLFESEQSVSTVTISEVIEPLPPSTWGRKSLLEMEGGEGEPAVMEEPPVESSPDDAVKSAFRSKIEAAFEDDTLDAKATVAKIKELVMSFEKVKTAMADKPKEGESEEMPAASSEEAVESLRAELEEMKNDRSVRQLLESSGCQFEEDDVEVMKPLTAKQRKHVIEILKKRTNGTTSLRESVNGNPGRKSASGGEYEDKWKRTLEKARA